MDMKKRDTELGKFDLKAKRQTISAFHLAITCQPR